MDARRRPWGRATAVASIVIALTVAAVPTAAVAAPPSGPPTPQEIAAAKQSESAKQAEITKIGALLQQEQQVADLAARDAQTKGEQYSIAQQNLDAATQKADQLATQQKAAEKQAAASAKQAGAIIAQLARTGGGDVTLGLITGSGRQTDSLLQRLGSMNRLSSTAQQLLQKAQYDRNTASSLEKQAAAAKTKRASLAADAKDALDAADSAAVSADAKVTAAQASQATMYAQLADLKGTTAALEQQAAEAAAAVTGPTLSTGSGSTGSSGSSGGSSGSSGGSSSGGSSSGGSGSGAPTGVDPTPPAPVASAVQTAIAFAKAQLGKPYANSGGIGPDKWDCSGLTLKAYGAAGVYIGGWGTNLQYNYLRSNGRLVDIRTNAIQPGDLLFYADGGNPNIANYHVAMAIGNGQMIEAPYEPLSVRIVAIRSFDLVPYAGRPTG